MKNNLKNKIKVDNAIILAAGFCKDFMPITYDNPLSLIKIKDEVIIERLIRQLQAKGISEITIVTGYLADRYKYLSDKFKVKLVFNKAFEESRNITSLMLTQKALKNTYIINSDMYLKENLFQAYENKSFLHIENSLPIGLAFLSKSDSHAFVDVVNSKDLMSNPNLNWTTILHKYNTKIKHKESKHVVEISNLDHLRDLDKKLLESLDNKIIETIIKVFNVDYNDIENITPLVKGMTNFSFLFTVENKSYVFRVPGRATDLLIDRSQEALVYKSIKDLKISDEVVYIDSKKGYKITKYYKDVRGLDPYNISEVRLAMEMIRILHQENLSVDHHFNIIERLEYYYSLCLSVGANFSDEYLILKEDLKEVIAYVASNHNDFTLCHVDPVAGNFLYSKDKELRLIDWEYSGMSDPILDIAMFAISQVLSDKQIDQLLSLYLERSPSLKEVKLFYAYISLASELWYLWTVFKEVAGDDYGSYKNQQLTYIQKYTKKFLEMSNIN